MASGASTVCRASLVLAAALAQPACAAETVRPDPRAEIGGRVIDAVTGAPIEGAVIVATWRIELPPSPAAIALGVAIGGHGGSERRTAYIAEALTDRDGRFSIPAWTAARQWHAGALTSDSPSIAFFKPGFSPAGATLSGWNGGKSEHEAGLRGPRTMALYAQGKKPKPDPGFTTSGLAVATREEETFRALQALQRGIEADAMAADAPEARGDSALRSRARQAQREARRLIDGELKRAYAAYTAQQSQGKGATP